MPSSSCLYIPATWAKNGRRQTPKLGFTTRGKIAANFGKTGNLYKFHRLGVHLKDLLTSGNAEVNLRTWVNSSAFYYLRRQECISKSYEFLSTAVNESTCVQLFTCNIFLLHITSKIAKPLLKVSVQGLKLTKWGYTLNEEKARIMKILFIIFYIIWNRTTLSNGNL